VLYHTSHTHERRSPPTLKHNVSKAHQRHAMQEYLWESFALLKALVSSIPLSGKARNSLCIAISFTSDLGYSDAAGIVGNTVVIVKKLWWCFGPFVYGDLNDGGDDDAVGTRGSSFMNHCSTMCPMGCSVVLRRDAARKAMPLRAKGDCSTIA
jgi:hypothetical protein